MVVEVIPLRKGLSQIVFPPVMGIVFADTVAAACQNGRINRFNFSRRNRYKMIKVKTLLRVDRFDFARRNRVEVFRKNHIRLYI